MGFTGALESLRMMRVLVLRLQTARLLALTSPQSDDLKFEVFSVPCEAEPIRNPEKSLW
jgi:hypothetical protein